MVLAFHGEPGLKSAVMSRLREHRRMDQIVQSIYFDDEHNKGCHLGMCESCAYDWQDCELGYNDEPEEAADG